jgi:hypothetical protein
MRLSTREEMIRKMVTSDDLEQWSTAMMDKRYLTDADNFDDTASQQAAKSSVNISKAIEKYLHLGGFFDWKEESKMWTSIERFRKKHRGYTYLYNAYPGGDGTMVVFSKIELPRAERVE